MKMSKPSISIIGAMILLLASLPVYAGERIAVVFRGDIALHQELADKLIAKSREMTETIYSDGKFQLTGQQR